MQKSFKKITYFYIFFMLLSFIFGFTYQTNLTEYNGIINHLCFNTLIAFPHKALSPNNANSNIYDEEKITPTEFKNILNELYNNNYILIDIEELYFIDNNILYPKTLYLPKDKKPLLISFDNVTYKSSYQNSGEIDKIIIDRNNSLATYSTKQSIQDRINHDNEFIPILESFINAHPDFSYNGARGIICFSGENGILGYSTNPKKSTSKQDTKRVSQIISRLKSSGWKFGCNNYKYVEDSTLSEIEFAKELSMWMNEIKPIIGNTNIYSYPYGQYNSQQDLRKEILKQSNFNIFFTNSSKPSLEFKDNSIYMTRQFVCGKSIRENANSFENLFNCENIYDQKNRLVPFNTSQDF